MKIDERLDRWFFEIEAVDVSESGACGVYSILPEKKLDAADFAPHCMSAVVPVGRVGRCRKTISEKMSCTRRGSVRV